MHGGAFGGGRGDIAPRIALAYLPDDHLILVAVAYALTATLRRVVPALEAVPDPDPRTTCSVSQNSAWSVRTASLRPLHRKGRVRSVHRVGI